MLDKIKDFFLNQALGRVLVRVSSTAAAYLASGALGAPLNVDPAQLNLLLQALAHSLITLLKPRASVSPAPAANPPA